MSDFDPGTFKKLYENDRGKELWEFLNSKRSLTILETCTYLKRPALEGLQPDLMEKFGELLSDTEDNRKKRDRYKQMLGRMVRQIMESRDYNLDRNGVIIRTGDLFTSASRYKKFNR